MKARMDLMCTVCGKRFKMGNTNGMPNGCGFMCKDGTLINMCQQCIVDLGRMTEAEKNKFFEDLLGKK